MKVIFYAVSVMAALSGCTLIGQGDLGTGESRIDERTLAEKMHSASVECGTVEFMLSDPNSLKKLERLRSSGKDMKEVCDLLDKVAVDFHQLSDLLVEQCEEADNSEVDETVRRMRSLRFPFVRFDPPQTLYDGIKFLAEGAKNHPEGDGLAFPILATMDCEDQLYVSPDCSMKSYSKKPIRWPPLPKITAEDISYYELLKLICHSVNCEFEIDSKLIRISKQDCKGRFIDEDYPAPLIRPDRDWLSWLAKHGVEFREGSEIFYEKKSGRLIAHLDVDELVVFENAFPLIYSGIKDDVDDR